MNKRPDLIILIAIWEFISAAGILILIAGIISVISILPVWSSQWGAWGWERQVMPVPGIAITVLSILAFLLVACAGIAVAGGIGLLQGKEWGRILSIIHAALAVFWIPIGTVIGILVLIYLVKPEVRDYYRGGSS